MPKIAIDYENTIFYKIYCKTSGVTDLYIGHTTNFVQRKYAHKQTCENSKYKGYACKLYRFIRDHGGWGNGIWTLLRSMLVKTAIPRDSRSNIISTNIKQP